MPNNDIKISADIQLNTSSLNNSLDQLKGRISSTLNKVTSSGAEKGFENIVSNTKEAVVQTENYETKLKSLQAQLQTAIAEAHKGNAVFGASDQYKNAISSVADYQRKIEELQTALAENARNASLPQAIQAPAMSAEQIAQAEQQISQYQAKIQELEATMTSMETRGTAFPALSQGIKEAEVELSASATQALLLQQNLEAVSGTAPATGSTVQQSMQKVSQSVTQGAQQVQQAKQIMSQPADVQTLTQSLNSLIIVIRRLETALNNVVSRFSDVKSTAVTAAKQISTPFSRASRSIKSMSGGTSKLGKMMEQTFSAKGFKRGLTTILKYGFGIRSLYFLFRKLRNAVKEGLQNLVKYEKAVGTSKAGQDANGVFQSTNQAITSLRTSLLYLKNAWAAAFAPIINAVMPMITTFINGIATVGNYVARLVGALTGQSRVLQAVKTSAGDYASSLDKSKKSANGAAKAQKKLNDRLAQFDDLNVLGKDDKDTGSGAGGGAGGASLDVDPKKMFKYTKVDKSEFQWILDLIDNIKKKIEKSGIINAVKDLWDAIKEFKDSPLAKVLGEIAGIITDSAFTSALDTVATAFKIIADILRGDVNKGWSDFMHLIANLTFDPLIGLASVIDHLYGTDFAGWLKNVKENFEGFLSNIENLKKIRDAIGWITGFIPTMQLLGTTINFLGELIGNLAFELQKFIEWLFVDVPNAIADAIEVVVGTVNMLVNDFKAGCEAIGLGFNVLVDGVANGVEAIVGFFTNAYNSGKTIGEAIVKFFTETIPNAVKTFVDGLAQKWTDIKTNATDTWNTIVSTIVGAVDNFKSNVETKVSTFKSNVIGAWETLKSDTIQKFTDLKNKAVEIFNGIKDAIKTPVNGIIGIVESLVNKVINAINSVADKLNSLPSLQFKNPFNGQDYKLGFNIPKLSKVSIPRLAEGAVIPPNKEFMAMLGDQSHGTNIEAPLDIIKQAVAEVMGNNGSAEMIQLLQQLITVVENKNLTIGDKEIGRANARFNKQQSIVRGTSF